MKKNVKSKIDSRRKDAGSKNEICYFTVYLHSFSEFYPFITGHLPFSSFLVKPSCFILPSLLYSIIYQLQG